MIAKTMTYETFDGEMITETFYFNLTKAELITLQMKTREGLDGMMDRIVKAKDRNAIISVFQEILHLSYGVKSDDGKQFMKSEEIFRSFSQTNAYSDLFIELGTNTEEAILFINGILPKDMKLSDKELADFRAKALADEKESATTEVAVI